MTGFLAVVSTRGRSRTGGSASSVTNTPRRLPAAATGIPFARGRTAAAYARRLGMPEQRTYDLIADDQGPVVRLYFRRPGRAQPAAGSVNS
ncbi:hypothetical protein [Streptomyces longisporus]|uniref:Uncharacterized protein n=1 Tax=Streptomyces longisporus TaxID=1948 RepID=A0ABN3KY79_STRLO